MKKILAVFLICLFIVPAFGSHISQAKRTGLFVGYGNDAMGWNDPFIRRDAASVIIRYEESIAFPRYKTLSQELSILIRAVEQDFQAFNRDVDTQLYTARVNVDGLRSDVDRLESQIAIIWLVNFVLGVGVIGLAILK